MAVFEDGYYWQRMPGGCLTPITGSDRYGWCRSMACWGIFFGLANETESLRFVRYNHINMLSQYCIMTLCLCLYASNEINKHKKQQHWRKCHWGTCGMSFLVLIFMCQIPQLSSFQGDVNSCCQLIANLLHFKNHLTVLLVVGSTNTSNSGFFYRKWKSTSGSATKNVIILQVTGILVGWWTPRYWHLMTLMQHHACIHAFPPWLFPGSNAVKGDMIRQVFPKCGFLKHIGDWIRFCLVVLTRIFWFSFRAPSFFVDV